MKAHHFAPWKGRCYRLDCVEGLGFKLLPDKPRGVGGHDWLKRMKKLDTQHAREKAVERLTELAETCRECGMTPNRKLKTSREWFRLEAYIYQTIKVWGASSGN